MIAETLKKEAVCERSKLISDDNSSIAEQILLR
jgi:hypothetical protein